MPQTGIPRDVLQGAGQFTLPQEWLPIKFDMDVGPLADFIYHLPVICFRNISESVGSGSQVWGWMEWGHIIVGSYAVFSPYHLGSSECWNNLTGNFLRRDLSFW